MASSSGSQIDLTVSPAWMAIQRDNLFQQLPKPWTVPWRGVQFLATVFFGCRTQALESYDSSEIVRPTRDVLGMLIPELAATSTGLQLSTLQLSFNDRISLVLKAENSSADRAAVIQTLGFDSIKVRNKIIAAISAHRRRCKVRVTTGVYRVAIKVHSVRVLTNRPSALVSSQRLICSSA